MKSREEVYNKLIEMNEHKDELVHFLNNPPNGGLWGISEKKEQFNQQCSMIDLIDIDNDAVNRPTSSKSDILLSSWKYLKLRYILPSSLTLPSKIILFISSLLIFVLV